MVLMTVAIVVTSGAEAQISSTNPTETRPKDSLINHVLLGQLMAKPHVYQGQKVRVVGYFIQQQGHGVLYAHQQDYDRSIRKNGLWTSFSPEVAGRKRLAAYLKPFNKKYVVMIGIFDKAKGRLGMFSGSIRAVASIDTTGASK